MPFAEISRARLHHRIDGDGPTVLLLHGAGGNSMSWFQQVPVLTAHFCCIAPDQPGFGLSDWRGAESEYAEVLIDLLDHYGVDRIGLVAHSLGGWAALRLALRQPRRVAALVLSSSWAGVQLPAALAALDARQDRLTAEQQDWREHVEGAHLPGAGARMLREQPALHWLAAGIAASNRGGARAAWTRDAQGRYSQALVPETQPEQLAGWDVPTLCITGDEDIVVPPAASIAVARALGAELHSIERAGHCTFLERADPFNAAMLSFLRRHLAP